MKHSVHKLLRWSWKIVMAGLVMPFGAPTKAEVTLDGTLGPAGSLTGPNFVIPDTVGQTVGPNLFHSFGLFNINTGESATFTGPAAIDNVISRVTGGSQSFIDGLLRSEIQSANLWFINPAGVLFGEHASLDIQGSFHVSTADYLKLGDGGRFEATHPENSVLTTAPPEAFGFLNNTPAPITVDHSTLIGEEGETLSLVGGDILVQGATLSAPGGRINLASAASEGMAVLAEDDLQMRPLREGEAIQQGDIRISQGSRIEVSGSGGAGIFIRGGRFTLEGGSNIETLTTGEDKGGDISVKATDSILVANSSIIARTSGEGDAGNIPIEAGSLELIGHFEELFIDDEFRFIPVIFPSEISSKTVGLGTGNAGTIDIKARDTIKMSFSDIDTSTRSEGDAGNIFIEAGSLEVMDGSGIESESLIVFDEGSVFNVGESNAGTIDIKVRDTFKLSSNFTGNSRITTSTSGEGDAGDISIEAGSLEVIAHPDEFGIITPSLISSDNQRGGPGNGGTIEIKARDTIKISFSHIDTSTSGEGDAGNIFIEAGSLELMDWSTIESESSGFLSVTHEGSVFIGNQGNAGTIDIKARDTIKMSDSWISTSTNSSEGNAGDISIEAGSLELMDGSLGIPPQIVSESNNSSVFGLLAGPGNAGTIDIKARDTIVLSGPETRISTSTQGSGAGGAIRIDATDIELSNGGTISAESSGTGLAGQIFIKAFDNLRLANGSQISVATTQADAGGITLEVGDLLHLSNGSSITTSAAGGTGKGGNITLNSVFVVLDEGSSIIANALEGQAGDIFIRILGGGALFRSPDSLIRASNRFGIEGSVVIDAPDTDIIAGFAGLPANFLDAATVLTQLCAERSGANVSSLVFRKYEVLPDSPHALRVQLPRAIPTPRTAKQSRTPRTYYAGSPLPPMISCLRNG
jgi:filamentous hemagglutinin family protein